MNGQQYFQAGDLRSAITAAQGEVKQHPTDGGRRGFLCELLCFAGEWERADSQLDLLATQDPQTMLGLSLWRHLLRAEQARQQFYTDGRVPEVLATPEGALKLHLEAFVCVREGKPGEAVELLEQAEMQRVKCHGTCNGKPFNDIRDLDDCNASFFEVLTSNGKYYWIPMERVEHIEFREPGRPRDLLWRRAHMTVTDGPDGEVYLPALYAGSHADANDVHRLGRATDWRGGQGTPVRGVGQRTFLFGDDTHTILELKELNIQHG